MALTFADTHNMIAYLTKSDASEGFDQIIDFLNASAIKYALTIATTPITAAIITAAPSAARRRKGVVIRDRMEMKDILLLYNKAHDGQSKAVKRYLIFDDKLEPAELKEVVEVVTTAKLMTEVVTAAATITATTTPITAATITATSSAARKRKGVVIRDRMETKDVL
nr:hypothetical protein [Tanacetum cinerariifolium]